MLDSDVGLAQRVERVAVVAIDRSRVDAVIDRKKRHARIAGVVRGERPETAVRVAVLWADPGMQYESAESRHRVHCASQQPLAPRHGKIRRDPLEERADSIIVWIMRTQHRRRRVRRFPCVRGTRDDRALPGRVASSKCESVIHPERQHIQEARDPNPAPFRTQAPPPHIAPLLDLDDADELREACEPAADQVLVERIVAVANQCNARLQHAHGLISPAFDYLTCAGRWNPDSRASLRAGPPNVEL